MNPGEPTTCSVSTPSRGRPEASGAIWDWRGDRARRQEVSLRRQALRRGVIQGVVGLGIGVVLLLFGHRVLAWVVLGLASLGLVLVILSPLGAFAAVQRVLTRVGMVIGTVMTWILLVPLFFLVFLPFGLLMRRGSRDPLERCLDRTRPTYWKDREPAPDGPDRYMRQF